MRKLLYLLCLLILSKTDVFANENTVSSALIEKNGIYYSKKTGRPFTGTISKRINENGRSLLMNTSYLQGRMHGEKSVVGANDQVLLRLQYVNANQEGLTQHFYENGIVKEETYYKNNKKQGISLFYHDNGVLWWELPYVDGLVQGVGKVYYKKGPIKQVANFKAGLLDGPMQIFREQGQLWLRFMYKEGKITQGICYLSKGSKRLLTESEHEMWNMQEEIYCP